MILVTPTHFRRRNLMKSYKFVVLLLAALALTACAVVDANAAGVIHSTVASSMHSLFGVDPMSIGASLAACAGVVAPGAGAEKHAAQSKFFRIALEGSTTDGRNIDRAWITQMAKNYNPEIYGARINLEHIRGTVPDGPFKAYGDVLGLEAREETGELAGKLGLYAQIAPTDDLVAMTKAKQKIYTSCEIDPSFADTKQAYLVGLAVTDSPASLGTSILSFAAQNPADSPFAHRKQNKDNLFTAAVDVELVLEEVAAPKISIFARVAELLGKKSGVDNTRFADLTQAVEALAQHGREQADLATTHAETVATLKAEVVDLTAKGKAAADDLAALKLELSNAGNGQPPRPVATGNSGAVTTDC
jgi:hypothetical protein